MLASFMSSRPPSLAGRAIVALMLMAGFYLLAIGLALFLLYLPYAEVVYANRLHLKLAAFCVIGALVIVWAIIPRPDRFEPPGPTLARERQRRLFDVIEDTAEGTRQAMPAEVYLVAEVNAFVTTRGGFMGFGSRRVMGLGLPLLQTLGVSELRAVLAHEFGHYHGGDTTLGPWIYKTRAAIGRTLQGLAGYDAFLQKPFVWYGSMFLRVSHAISRRQELTADQLAAQLYGAGPLTSALVKIRRAAMAFPAYWSTEVSPVLGAGFRPPVAAGFSHFLAADRIAAAVDEQARRPEEADPYDTHPPLHERVAALAALPPGAAADPRRAIELLEDVDALEQQLLAPIVSERPLPAIGWDDVGRDVYIPSWHDVAERHAAVLSGVGAGDLLDRAPELARRLVESLPAEELEQRTPEQQAGFGRWALGATLAGALAARGWRVRALPGEPIVLEGEGGALDPFQTVDDLVLGKIDQTTWRARCAALGLAGVTLGAQRTRTS
jgi:heat shock protein HtpX